MSYSLNFYNGIYIGHYLGTSTRLIKGDTRSLTVIFGLGVSSVEARGSQVLVLRVEPGVGGQRSRANS